MAMNHQADHAISSPASQQPSDGWFYSSEERDWPEPPPEPVPCEYCGKLRYHKGKELSNMGDRIFWIPTAIPCNCPGAVEAREKERLEREQEEKRKAEDEIRRRVSRLRCDSGMRGRFLDRTFSNYLTPDERTAKAKETAIRYAQNFDNMSQKKNGLFILGDIGVGKTHLAAAIANDLIQRGRPVICMTMIDMLARIKATYDKREISEGEILRVYETVPLLIIDDMGKEPPTDWGVSKIYNHKRPLRRLQANDCNKQLHRHRAGETPHSSEWGRHDSEGHCGPAARNVRGARHGGPELAQQIRR